MDEHRVSEAKGVSHATNKIEVAEFREGRREAVDGGHAGAKPSEFPRTQPHDREPARGERGEPERERAKGPRGARTHEDDVGRPDLESEALQGQGSAPTGQLPDPTDLPRVEGGVGRGASAEVEEEHSRITTGWKAFEHRGWVVERVGG